MHVNTIHEHMVLYATGNDYCNNVREIRNSVSFNISRHVVRIIQETFCDLIKPTDSF